MKKGATGGMWTKQASINLGLTAHVVDQIEKAGATTVFKWYFGVYKMAALNCFTRRYLDVEEELYG